MTRPSGKAVPDNEVPIVVPTPDGSATVSVVAVVMGSRSMANVDRLILKSTMDDRPDVYAVFERHRGDQSWRKVTADLSLAELEHWQQLRRPDAWPTRPFQQWLDRVVGHAGMTPQR